MVTRDTQDPLTGDLDGAEERLFLLGHLFGHMVQWNVDLDAVAEADLPAIIAYERQAAAYALPLFGEVDITDADK